MTLQIIADPRALSHPFSLGSLICEGGRDMARDFSRAFYKSAAWRVCRDSYWRKAGGLCEDCLKQGRITTGEEVHHIQELTPDNIGNPAITLNPANLVLLCHACHMARHKSNKPQRYSVDQASGKIVSIPL